jgi:hypothetical protein
MASHHWLLKKDLRQDQSTDTKFELEDDRDFVGIRCPRCRWQPKASSTWYCDGSRTPESPFDGCGTTWNTFVTRGRCPGCGHQWRWTVCHRCDQWSLHEDWYEERDHG